MLKKGLYQDTHSGPPILGPTLDVASSLLRKRHLGIGLALNRLPRLPESIVYSAAYDERAAQ